jgi:hypothetical protein
MGTERLFVLCVWFRTRAASERRTANVLGRANRLRCGELYPPGEPRFTANPFPSVICVNL